MLKKRGHFITFEGPEGSGKSTVIRAVARSLKRRGYRVLVLREPGGCPISEKVRGILLDRRNLRMTVEAELLLYLAARAQVVREVIRPALRAGKVVLCDRFHDSTVAYQGFGGGAGFKTIEVLGGFAKGGLEPSLTVLLDCDVRTGLRRAGRRDRLEKKSVAFHGRVRRGFLALARRHRRRFVIIRDAATAGEKCRRVTARVEAFLGEGK